MENIYQEKDELLDEMKIFDQDGAEFSSEQSLEIKNLFKSVCDKYRFIDKSNSLIIYESIVVDEFLSLCNKQAKAKIIETDTIEDLKNFIENTLSKMFMIIIEGGSNVELDDVIMEVVLFKQSYFAIKINDQLKSKLKLTVIYQ